MHPYPPSGRYVACSTLGCGSFGSEDRGGRCEKHRRARRNLTSRRFERRLRDPDQSEGFLRTESAGGSHVVYGITRGFFDTARIPHRIGGPAETRYRPNGMVMNQVWFFAGLAHRVDGYGLTEYTQTGAVRRELFYVGGAGRETPLEFAGELAIFPPDRLRAEFELSSYAVLLDEGHAPASLLDPISEGILSVSGIRAVLEGAPVEWVRAYESAESS